jgi:hypothetical protein
MADEELYVIAKRWDTRARINQALAGRLARIDEEGRPVTYHAREDGWTIWIEVEPDDPRCGTVERVNDAG